MENFRMIYIKPFNSSTALIYSAAVDSTNILLFFVSLNSGNVIVDGIIGYASSFIYYNLAMHIEWKAIYCQRIVPIKKCFSFL